MTQPISPDSSFWNVLDRFTRIMALTALPWMIWVTTALFSHRGSIDREADWRLSHMEFAKERVSQIERLDKEVQEWRVRMEIFAGNLRATDTAVRDVAAQVKAMSDITSKIQDNMSSIKEKIISLQVLSDNADKK